MLVKYDDKVYFCHFRFQEYFLKKKLGNVKNLDKKFS